jgi:hypothetical protein
MEMILPTNKRRGRRKASEKTMSGHVYIVDDDDRFRDSLCALIGSVGLHVEGWSDPEIS